MEDLFVSYDLSMIMKDLGFNDQCFGFYTDSKHYQRFISDSGNNSDLNNLFGDESKFAPTAPTYQQAFDWLLKKINKDVLFDSNKYSIRFDDVYYSVLLGGVAMFVFVTKENVINELLILIKEKGEK